MSGFVNIGVESWTCALVRYGLIIAAAFQFICLLICAYKPETQTDVGWFKGDSDDESSEQGTPQNTPRRPHYRPRKQEKKKRR